MVNYFRGDFMNDSLVRLCKISIDNFKNVQHGKIDLGEELLNPLRADTMINPCVLGLYGQNGSGKTSLVDALQVLKYLLGGQAIPNQYAEFIQVGEEFSHFYFEFMVRETEESLQSFQIYYEFDVVKGEPPKDLQEQSQQACFVANEVIKYSYTDTENPKNNQKKQNLIDTRGEEIFSPKKKYALLMKNTDPTDLLVEKKILYKTGHSFIFSSVLQDIIFKNANIDSEIIPFSTVLKSLSFYGKFNLFVISSQQAGRINLNLLPLSFQHHEKVEKSSGGFVLPWEKSEIIPSDSLELVEKIISNMNVVLEQLVPGLTIKLSVLGNRTLIDGKDGTEIELLSCKNDKKIPLRYESDGIKKMISILHLLIAMFHNPSVTVVVDELDAGIFEYLLGELLKIVSTKGRGQLLFTSHNLRALETLDKKFVAFTTTNPLNRYIRLSYVKPNHNLRDFYYRDIVLGEQDEEVYAATSNAEIAFAFREAGDYYGS